ncbi:MAG: tetratricopeptide repeat protein [Marinomonas sp.]
MTKNIKGWHQPAQTLWLQGDKNAAIQSVITEVNQRPTPKPIPLHLQLSYYLFLSQHYMAASEVLKQALILAPDDWEIFRNLTVCLSRSGNHQEVIALFAKTDPDKINNDYYCQDVLCSSYYKLSQFNNAKQAGSRSLQLKHQHKSQGKNLVELLPNSITSPTGQQDIISFSLWGSGPRYLRGALDNLLASGHLYPDWICRFYIDSSVPAEFIDTLNKLGCQVIVNNHQQTLKEKLTWRFKVLSDPNVRYFLIRDCDSVVNAREQAAVNEWLASDKPFHIMRDWWTHTDLILAGMWGGTAGIINNIEQAIKHYQPKEIETPNIDQWFLRDCIWPHICDQSMVHDRYFDSYQSISWPTDHNSNNHHVGQDLFTARRSLQTQRLSAWIDQSPCLQLPISLANT